MERSGVQSKDEVDSIMLKEEVFGDFAGTMFGDGVKSAAGSPLEDGLLVDPESCGMCGLAPL